jgi:predicted RND superfamily exporter protein
MRNITKWIIKHEYPVLAFFAARRCVCAFLIPAISVNYDLSEYLPEDSMTSRAIETSREEFGYPGRRRS